MEIDYKTLSERLQGLENYSDFVTYIFKVQGAELQRLDYPRAAAALGVSRQTISRYVTKLADKKVIILVGDSLILNNDILKG